EHTLCAATRRQIEVYRGLSLPTYKLAQAARRCVHQAALDAVFRQHEFAETRDLLPFHICERQGHRLDLSPGMALAHGPAPVHLEAAIGAVQRRHLDVSLGEPGHPRAV